MWWLFGSSICLAWTAVRFRAGAGAGPAAAARISDVYRPMARPSRAELLEVVIANEAPRTRSGKSQVPGRAPPGSSNERGIGQRAPHGGAGGGGCGVAFRTYSAVAAGFIRASQSPFFSHPCELNAAQPAVASHFDLHAATDRPVQLPGTSS